MRSVPPELGPRDYRQWVADQLLKWAEENEAVVAWFWFGSYSLGQWSSGTDLDAAVLFYSGASLDQARDQLRRYLGPELRHCLVEASPTKFIGYLGHELLRMECVMATDPEQLAWLADSDDVPAPRLVLAFERAAAGQGLLLRAQRPCNVDSSRVINQEVEKFLEGFEACSRAHCRSDAYGFYFHYNLALGRLARLVQISRHRAERLYLPPQLTNTRLRLEERPGFIDLAGELYLPRANQQKRKLAAKFVEFVTELSGVHEVKWTLDELNGFLNAVIQRDYFWNVRDWAAHLDGLIRPGIVVRASTLTRWQSDKELSDWLRMKRVTQIVDLRTDNPRDGLPYEPAILAGIDYFRLPLHTCIPMDPVDRAGHYTELVLNNLEVVVKTMQVIADSTDCTVIHCYAGTDRTGVIMAMIGLILELPDNLLVKDYLASNPELQPHFLTQFLESIRASGGAFRLLSQAGLTADDVHNLRKRLLRETKT